MDKIKKIDKANKKRKKGKVKNLIDGEVNEQERKGCPGPTRGYK